VGVGIATVLTGQGSLTRRFDSPNDVHVQYYRWDCVENCVQPEFRWTQQIKEKYNLTSFLKVYGGFTPDHDGEQVSIKLKSPMRMLVAMLPSQIAGQLHLKPETLESALEKNACQHAAFILAVRVHLQFGRWSTVADCCTEAGANVPNHKKAEIEMLAAKCVANCRMAKTNNNRRHLPDLHSRCKSSLGPHRL